MKQRNQMIKNKWPNVKKSHLQTLVIREYDEMIKKKLIWNLSMERKKNALLTNNVSGKTSEYDNKGSFLLRLQ